MWSNLRTLACNFLYFPSFCLFFLSIAFKAFQGFLRFSPYVRSFVLAASERKENMGFSKEDKSRRVLRGFKTLFFLITMVVSFLLFSAPVLVVIADTLLPCALISSSLSVPSLSFETLSSNLSDYDFRHSIIDVPLISIVRSAVILCESFRSNSWWVF